MSVTRNKYIGTRTGFSTLSTGEKKNYLEEYKKALEQEQQAQKQEAARQAETENSQKNKGGFLGGLGYTLEKLGLGAVRSVEGVLDYVVGGVADLVGADEFADEVLKNDWLNYEHADEWYNPGKGWEFVGDVAGGVGGMLPSVTLAIATGGTSALAQGVGTAAFGLGAAGQAVSEQTKKSGSATGKEWLYGTASGAAEAAIESISGGIGGMASGTVLGKQLAKTTGGKVATSFIGEGLEEVAADILDPALKRTTGVDKEATVDWSGLPRTFLVGGTTGAVMGGLSRARQAGKVGGFNTLNAIETSEQLNERMSENNVRQAQDKKVRFTETDIADTKARLSQYLQRMDEPTRQRFFAENKRVAPFFNADGTVVDNVVDESAAERFSIKTDAQGRQYVQADRKVLTGTNAKAWGEQITSYINEQIRKGNDIKIKTVEGDTLTITENTAGKAAYWNENISPQSYKTKLQAEAHIDELSQVSVSQKDQFGNKKITPDRDNKHAKRNLAKDGWSYRTAKFKDFDGQEYNLTVSVAMDGTVESVYNVGKIEKTSADGESRLMPQRAADVSTNSISENPENVNSFSEESAKTNSQSIGNLDESTYSASLKGRENTLKYQPVALGTEVSETAKKALKNIELMTNGKTDVVLTTDVISLADGRTANGAYVDGVLYMNANADSYARTMTVASHELTHALEDTKEYDALGAFIEESVKGDSALAEKYNIEKYRRAYEDAQNGNFSAETREYEARTEMYADFVANEILAKENVVQRLVNRNRNVAVRLWTWLRSTLKRMGMNKAERAEYDALRKAEKLLAAAIESSKGGISLEEVEQRNQAVATLREKVLGAEMGEKETTDNESVDVGAAESESSARYSVGKSFAEQVDEVIAGKHSPTLDLYISKTPRVFLNIGFPDKPMLMRNSKVKEILNKHTEMNTDIIKQIPNAIKNPIMILKSKTNPDVSVVTITDVMTDKGEMIVPVWINQDGVYLDVELDQVVPDKTNFVASAYGRDVKTLLEYALENDGFLYLNKQKEKVENLLTRHGLQLSAPLKVSNSTISIRDNSEKVNTSGEKSSKNSSERYSIDVEEREKQKRAAHYVTTLRKYLHRLNISETTKAELEERYGEAAARRILNVWDNITDEEGSSLSSAVEELAASETYLEGYHESDLLVQMDALMRSGESNIGPVSEIDYSKQIRRVTEEKPKKTLKQNLSDKKADVKREWTETQIQFTNAQAGIERAGKELGVKDIEAKTHRVRSSTAAAINMITNEQWDYKMTRKVGKSLAEIFNPIFKKGDAYYAEFCEYLLHWHNADRMRLEGKAQNKMRILRESDRNLDKILSRKNISDSERTRLLEESENGRRYLKLQKIRNKPVFGDEVTAAISTARYAELARKHPEFLDLAKDVWQYNRNLLRYRADSGLITQAQCDEFIERYPHYVPTIRDMDAVALGLQKKRNVEVKKTIKNATGGTEDILDISVMMGNQTKAVVRAAAENELLNSLYDAAVKTGNFNDIELLDQEAVEDIDINYDNSKPKENKASFYKNGEKVTVKISKQIFLGLEAYHVNTHSDSKILENGKKFARLQKASVTQWNPGFLVSNIIRDLQEAIFYTKNGMGKFIISMPKAIKEMAQKGNIWKIYLAMGGTSSGYFNNETGVYDPSGNVKKGFKKILEALETANGFVEQIPRFTEFMLSVQNGKTYEQALLDSADVTTNFSRGGKVTKMLNRTIIPFLNPSVQGWSKLWRTATGRKTAREWFTLIAKATIAGLSVGLINDLINGDDDEYKNLSMRDKENYYLIKIGDKFLKLPKGRIVAALGSISTRMKEYIDGNEDAFKGWVGSVSQMISPVETATRTIFSPISDVRSNTTWYGGLIESQALQNYAPSERYDESTSSIAIAIGQAFNVSPKKVHYLIDQYTGVIGDVLLPLSTKKAEKGILANRFTLDSVTQNGISTDFYETLDELKFAKNTGDAEAALVYRYLNKISTSASEMYQQKRDIENSDLSDKEKREQMRIIQATINELLISGLESAEAFENSVIGSDYEKEVNSLFINPIYKTFTEAQQTSTAQKLTNYYYAKTMSDITGEKHDAKYYLYDALGGVNAAVYLTDIAAIESDKDSNGEAIANSRRSKVHTYIEKLRLTAVQKYILMTLAGYVPTELGKMKVENYLRSKGFSIEESKAIWN